MTSHSSSKPQHKSISVIINQHRFLQAVRPVLLDRGRFATGRIRRRQAGRSLEFIINDWTVTDGVPNGKTMAPMLDWAVMSTNFDNIAPVERLAEIVQPRQSHLLVVISLDPNNYSAMSVLIVDEGQVLVPDRVQLIGHGLLTLENTSITSATEDTNEPQSDKSRDDQTMAALRASRTAGALGPLYYRLNTMQVILIGAGRGAQELARQLVAAGLRRLIIIDNDTLEIENLDAMPLARSRDLGMNKAKHLALTLRCNQPDLVVTVVPHSVLSTDGMRMLLESRTDTVFSFVDNNVARLAVARLCQETETVHVDVGTLIEWEGENRTMSADVRLLEPRLGCVACVPKMEELDNVLYELAAPPDVLHRGRRTTWDEQRAGSLLHVNAMACSLALEVWFRWLSGNIQTSHWLRLRWPANEIPEIIEGVVGPDESCQFCRPQQETGP